ATEGVTVHDVHVVAALTVSGRVEGPDGVPVPHATLTLSTDAGYASDDGPFQGRKGNTDEAGAFVIRGVPVAHKAHVYASANGFADAEKRFELEPAKGAQDVVVRLDASAIVHGRVVAAD